MLGSSVAGLQRLMNKLNEVAEEFGMSINIKKTKIMRISKSDARKFEIKVNGQCLEQVSQFKYLGSTITEDGRCQKEVRIRIATAKEAFNKRKCLLSRKMNRQLKKRIIKSLIWSVALYGAETWTLAKGDISRLEAFEMWIWRRMEKISWTEHVSNKAVFKQIDDKRSLITVIQQRQKNWMGHVLRRDGLLKNLLEGRLEGKKPRGRPRKKMLDRLGMVIMKRRAEDRISWKCWEPETCQ